MAAGVRPGEARLPLADQQELFRLLLRDVVVEPIAPANDQPPTGGRDRRNKNPRPVVPSADYALPAPGRHRY